MIEYNIAFVVAAYAITWTVLLGYLIRLLRKDKLAHAALSRADSRRGGERS
jgi:CcmD family protein